MRHRPGIGERIKPYGHFKLNGLTLGGNFRRIALVINGYATLTCARSSFRGHVMLDRFQLKGATQLFRTRFQVLVI